MLPLVRIFTNPGQTFQESRERGAWTVPFLVTVFLAFATVLVTVRLAGMELITLQRYQHNPDLAKSVGENGIDAKINTSNDRTNKLLYIAKTGGTTVAVILILGAIFTVAAALMRAQPLPSFAQMVGMASLAIYPFVLLNLLAAVILLTVSQDHSALDLSNLAGINLGLIFDRTRTSAAIYEVAASLDLLQIAQVVFLAFGFAKSADLHFRKGLILCFALWGVVVLWRAAVAAFV